MTTRIADLIAGRDVSRALRILHSMPAPDSTTRYATHMAATEDLATAPTFFTWRRALFGNYDVFHLHWPEHLVPSGRTLSAVARRRLASIFIGRLERKRTPVVRTLHNLIPHDNSRPRDTTLGLHGRLQELTRLEIHLVDGDPRRDGVRAALIPHGSYREPYAIHVLPKTVPGRVLFFGMIKPYKGVPELLEAFALSPHGSLRIVGAPSSQDVVALVRAATESDSRVSARFGFIPDEALATEIGSAELVALPYQELHSSGVVLVALSLGRPVLVPRTPTTEALVREVGDEWVRVYDPPLRAADLVAAQTWAAGASSSPPPNLTSRNWSTVRSRHGVSYRAVGSYHSRSGAE
ncbi:glycosyltransferase [Microbacterium lushaniae]|nr:glycosyltransferase [Microbacterium lushaniae]KAA9159871.1 glycosyltransferase [Microbacterium lushaniae]